MSCYTSSPYSFTTADAGGGTSVEVIDNLNSSDTKAALSANQGRILNNEIQDLRLSIGEPFEYFFDPSFTRPILDLDIGAIWWDAANSQPYIVIGSASGASTMSNIGNIFNTSSTSGSDRKIDFRGSFVVVPLGSYYFTNTGTVNTEFGLIRNTTRTQVESIIESTSNLCRVQLDVFRVNSSVGIITGKVVNIALNTNFTIQAETPVAQFNPGDYPFSFGDIENTQNAGVVMPFKGQFTDFTYRTSSALTATTTFTIVRNQILTTAELTILALAPSFGVLPLSTSVVSFDRGDEITFIAVGGTPDVRFFDILLAGRYIL